MDATDTARVRSTIVTGEGPARAALHVDGTALVLDEETLTELIRHGGMALHTLRLLRVNGGSAARG